MKAVGSFEVLFDNIVSQKTGISSSSTGRTSRLAILYLFSLTMDIIFPKTFPLFNKLR